MITKVSIMQLVVLLLVGGCVEPFSPDFPEVSTSLLVVEGAITDAEGPYTVQLSRSFAVSSGKVTPASGADITIEEENGPTAVLTETSPGIYVTDGIRGGVGNRYRLTFSVNGNQYSSSWETIRRSPKIDSVYWRLAEQENSDREVESGIQFFVASDGSETDIQFYRWVWDETWEISVNHATLWYYLGDFELEFIPADEQRNLCWVDFSPRTINVFTTRELGRNVVSEHPLYFSANDQERFTRRYSLLVRQFALEEEEFNFWKNLEESSQGSADLFEKQPARVVGNIQNLSNPDEAVLGYFSASGVSEQRVFIKSSEVTPEFRRRPRCSLDSVSRSFRHDFRVFERLRSGGIFYSFWYTPLGGQILGSLITTSRCSDCVFKGGNIEKPEFWDD